MLRARTQFTFTVFALGVCERRVGKEKVSFYFSNKFPGFLKFLYNIPLYRAKATTDRSGTIYVQPHELITDDSGVLNEQNLLLKYLIH